MLSIVRQKLNRLVHLISTHRALAFTAIIFAVLFFSLAGHIGWVHAAPDPASTVAPSGTAPLDGITGYIVEAITRSLLATARFFLSVTIFILTFIIEVAGYNGYLDANAVNVGWVMVRDMTNMLFIVALLVIAIGTILGLEHYEWKHMLVELVIAAVLVNFSRTICGLIIDAAQVVMNTFVNGIAATAAGNLVNAFGLNGIFKISPDVPSQNLTNMNVFTAGLAAVFFSAMVMCILGMFLVMLVIRMVTLWVLIVLSPIGFVLRILPQTEEYAKEWWGEFSKNVITGPILLFFIWLSFVTVGNGRINEDINAHSSTPQDTTSVSGAGAQSAGIGDFMKWNDMANFIIACAMLIVGAEVAQKLGGKGAGLIEQGLHAGQKLGAFASGVSTARWAAGGVAQGAVAGGKFVAMNFPVVGGNYWKALGQNIGGRIGGKYYQLQQKRQQRSKDAGAYAKEYQDKKLSLEQKLQKGGLTEKERTDTENELAKHKKDFSAVKYASSRAREIAWMPPSRALKMGEDAMDIMEFEKTKLEKDASTSSTATGRWKAQARVEAEIIEERGKEKGQRRSDNIRSAMFGEAKEKIADQLPGLKEENKGLTKAQATLEEELKIAKKAGDKDTVNELTKQLSDIKRRVADSDSKLKPMQKTANQSLAYTLIKAKGQAHTSHLQADEAEHKLEEQFGHGEGHALHVQAAAAEMGRDTAKNNIEAHDLATKMKLMLTGLGDALLGSQAELTAIGNALATAKQNILSNIRETRGVKSKDIADAAAVKAKKDSIIEVLGVTASEFDKAGESVKKLTLEHAEASKKLSEIQNLNTDGKSEEEKEAIQKQKNEQGEKVEKIEADLKKQRELADGKVETWVAEKPPEDKDVEGAKRKIAQKTIVKRNDSLKKLATSNAEVGSAYYQSLQDKSKILESKSINKLNEMMSQSLVGDEQGVEMPDNSDVSAVESILSTYYKGMGKAEILQAAKERFPKISAKQQAFAQGKIDYDEKSQREDELFTQSILAELHKEKYMDDQSGKTEASLGLDKLGQERNDFLSSQSSQSGASLAQKIGKALASRQASRGGGGASISQDQIMEMIRKRDDAFGDRFKQLLKKIPDMQSVLANLVDNNVEKRTQAQQAIIQHIRVNDGRDGAAGFGTAQTNNLIAHMEALAGAYVNPGNRSDIDPLLSTK